MNATPDPADQYRRLALFWTDLLHLMSSKPQALASIGPMRSYADTSKKITVEMIEAAGHMKEFNDNLMLYYKQLADTWSEAQKKVNAKVQSIPKDSEQFEAYKRIWIDILDNDFTELFDSKEFGKNYGQLVSKELELAKRWRNITDAVLKAANLPNKKEMDEIYKEMHDLKRRVSALESELRFEKKKAGRHAKRTKS